jgi:outer membrane immunogenic protein
MLRSRLLASLIVAAGVIGSTAPSFGQVAAIPPFESNDSQCGWALGTAAGVLAGGALLTNGQKVTSDWSGFYVGGHLGCAWAGQTWTNTNNAIIGGLGDTATFDNDGWIGGAQLGYNWQFGRWVVGLEGTYSNGNSKDETAGQDGIFAYRLSADISHIITATARLGYAFDNRFMGYVKAGFASAEIEAGSFLTNGAQSASGSSSSRHNGYALGAGIEYMATNNIVLGLDYTFINLEDKEYSFACGAVCVTAPRANVDPDDIHMLTGRISFKFGGQHQPAYAPLK